ncbi:MAG: glycosyltransferase family 2 protein [Solirubrobacteraceae bacterium]
MSPPAVSVVVATHDRPARLARLLEALRAQDLAEARFEVVVVDDGSGPETAARLHAAAGVLDLRVVRHERARGRGAARNAGWRAAGAPLIAFTDDDCVPAPGWLAAGLAAHRRGPKTFVQGPTTPEPGEAEGLWVRTQRIEALGPWYETCNIFYPRELLERLGGFADLGTAWGGEDTDLAWRALEAGWPARWESTALVHHAVDHVGARGQLRGTARLAVMARLLAQYPPIRRTLVRGIFYNTEHYLLVRSLVALALPRPVRRFLLVRHLVELVARARDSGAGPWLVPYLLALDTAELAVLVRAGIRHRTLIL